MDTGGDLVPDFMDCRKTDQLDRTKHTRYRARWECSLKTTAFVPFSLFSMFRYFILSGFILACSSPARAALINGLFKGALTGDRIEVVVPHYYLDGKIDRYKSELDGQQQFSLIVKVPEPQLVFLVYNDDRLPIFLEPDDTLFVRADAFKFPLVVHFGSWSGANNTLLKKYLQENQQDFDEFNDLRFKIGQWWASLEVPMNQQMENLSPADFRSSMDKRKTAALALLDEFNAQNPNALTPAFNEWLFNEITYYWAYHLLVYGQVYGNAHMVQPDFFGFLYDAPTISNMIGSAWYRQYLLALMARQQVKTGKTDNFWAGQYYLSGNLLSGKPLAFFRSEMINIAFSAELYREILPLFNDFMQHNTQVGYDEKVADLYQKFAKVSPGAPAPGFTASDAGGHTVTLNQFRGKVVYLNFWASWCGACIKKMEEFNAFAPDLHNQGIEIVNVSIDENQTSWQTALHARDFKGINLLASTGTERNVAVAYSVEAVPQYFIVNRDGKFAEKSHSNQPEDIRKRLAEIAKSH
jgi:peroxiredoxin